MSAPDPTADYRKYPKGPNFLLIVILSSVVLFNAAFLCYKQILADSIRDYQVFGPSSLHMRNSEYSSNHLVLGLRAE